MRSTPAFIASLALAFAACGGDDQPSTDVGADTSDATPGDTTTPPDSTPPSDTPETSEDVLTPDTPDATDTIDASEEVLAPCLPDEEVFDDPRIISCKGALTFYFYGEDTSASSCPPTWRFNDTVYPSLEALAAAEGCDASCEYRATHAVDLIGCQSGFRTGYEVYEPFAPEGCFEAVFATPGGLLTDLCAWPEKACRADCNPDCAEGTVGTLDASQLSAQAGALRLGPTTEIAQTFRVESDGILTGVELRLTRCDSDTPALLAILDEGGVEVAWAELSAESQPAGCDGAGSLSDGAPGVGYFAVEDACLAVTAGETLQLVLRYPFCDLQSCPDGVGVGYAAGDPYEHGALSVNGDEEADQDLAFKVFVQ